MRRGIVPDQVALIEMISRKTGNPLGAPRDVCYRWALDLGLRRGGDTILYTGCLYQLMAYSGSLVSVYERLGRLGIFAARILYRLSPNLLTWIISKSVRADKDVAQYAERSLRSIVEILRRSGIDFGYLYEDDIYSGVYLYELGLEEVFADHANMVYRILVSNGVKRVITVDPHTTYILREIYPRFIDSYNIEVLHYIEVIRTRTTEKKTMPRESEGSRVGGIISPPAIHDSCYMVRKLGLYSVIRSRMKDMKYIEPRNSGLRTACCGGPIEGISPKLALRIAIRRARELADTGSGRVIVMCPICYVNLKRGFQVIGYRTSIQDLSEELAKTKELWA